MAESSTLATLAAAISLSACGYTSGGTGSGTLEVTAEATYYANSEQAVTDVRVEVFYEDGQVVADAEVVITDGETGESIFDPELMPFENRRSEYRDSVPGYFRRLQLNVERADHWIEGTILGPAAHTITKPANARTRKIDRDMWVEWAVEDGIRADQVIIELSHTGFETLLTDDPGAYAIPQTSLGEGSGEVSVLRRNSVVLAGGIKGSSLSSGFAIENDVTIEVTP